jgi:hypothetical protein
MNRHALIVLGLALLASSTARADLKTYDVDAQYRQEVYAALQRILNNGAGDGKTPGMVELLPTGQLLVNGPPEALTQVEAVLASLRARPVDAAPRVTLRYWAVLGSRDASNAAAYPGSAPPPVLNPVLAELKPLHGELVFRVIGAAAVTTESGQPGQVNGTAFDVEQRAYVQGDTLNAWIEMELRGTVPSPDGYELGSLEVQTTLRRGEFVVLGESNFRDGPIFFIVHWPQK